MVRSVEHAPHHRDHSPGGLPPSWVPDSVSTLAPHENVSAAVLALVVYGSAMYIVPACRPARGCLISPLSWSLLLFGVSMVVCPILIAFYGPTRSVLPTLPSGESTDLALMLTTVAFVAFCVGFCATNGWFRRRIATRRMTGWFDSPLLLASPTLRRLGSRGPRSFVQNSAGTRGLLLPRP